jgi:uncharacterized protein YyaL (SSP411 family)
MASQTQHNKNQLSSAHSPYLLQHAGNPVNWYPWGDKAFEIAKKQDKPIFLSIGYATCHWCHVMAHESFEDETVAKMMNEAFINIKVDREERPEIDNTYMQVCQMLTGRGGWPLTIVMTPEKKPFFAATYLPKKSRHGQPGLLKLIPELQRVWKEEQEKIEGSAQKITQAFQKSIGPRQHSCLSDDILEQTFKNLRQQFDEDYGGFGNAPKFPTPHTLIFLLRYANAFDDKSADCMAESTLTNMRYGGIFDHIGGGFHRYSTDRYWLLPHFEKMLCDQAMHLLAYSEAWQALKKPLYKQTAQSIAAYLLRDLQDEDGAFYSAEDADSEREEGTFYLWTVDEIQETLAEEEVKLAVDIFNIKPDGNYRDEATSRSTGKNILHYAEPIGELADKHNLGIPEFHQKIGEIRCKLFGYRAKRERPFLDDKILTDWNGLTIAALAKAGRLLKQPNYIHQAEQAASFIFEHLQTTNSKLLHRWHNGDAAIIGTADDYAFLIWGLLELYESTFQTAYLQRAHDLQKTFLTYYWDHENSGFFFTSRKSEKLLGQKKEYFDSALPSCNSVAANNLLRLGRICGKPEWEEKAGQIIQSAAENVKSLPASFTQLLQAHLWSNSPGFEIVISGKKKAEKTQQFINQLQQYYLPHSVVILNDPNNQNIGKIAPFTTQQPMIDGKPTVYVCQNYACQQPVHIVEEMNELLKEA